MYVCMSRLSYGDSSELHLGGHTASERIRASNSCVQMWCSVAVASGSGRESFAVALAGTKREGVCSSPPHSPQYQKVTLHVCGAVSRSLCRFSVSRCQPDAAINMQCSSKTP